MAPSLEQYRAEHARARQGSGSQAPAIVRLRDEAFARFLALGFPTSRDEEWRFTSVAPIAGQAFALADPPAAQGTLDDVARFRLTTPLAAELVFVDGHYVPALSSAGDLPRGARVESLAAALAAPAGTLEPHLARVAAVDGQAFTALNTAFLSDGAFIDIPAHAVVERPIHLLFVSTRAAGERPTMSHPRVLVVMGDDSQAVVVESYAGQEDARGFTNTVAELVLGQNAVLQHYKVQSESLQASHVGSTHVRAARAASVTSHSISLGGALVRNDVVAVLAGEGVACTLNGLYVADGGRLVDNHTTVDHAMPHCDSREIYKGVLADRARGVFNGKIVVRPDAQKTDAKQTNRALLLSEDAQINTKPQLEIFANDVKCTHGAAVGQLDDEAVFYLRSRGLGEADARRLLIHAFAADVLNRMPLEPVRTAVEAVLQRQLARALGAAA